MTAEHTTNDQTATVDYDREHAEQLWNEYNKHGDRIPYLLEQLSNAWERVKIDYVGDENGNMPTQRTVSTEDQESFDFWLDSLVETRNLVDYFFDAYLTHIRQNDATQA
jgi:hypothetical protein